VLTFRDFNNILVLARPYSAVPGPQPSSVGADLDLNPDLDPDPDLNRRPKLPLANDPLGMFDSSARLNDAEALVWFLFSEEADAMSISTTAAPPFRAAAVGVSFFSIPTPGADTHGPDWTKARLRRPLVRGDTARTHTDMPPLLWPITVTEDTSPPKFAALACTLHRYTRKKQRVDAQRVDAQRS
jgi:hypothetical protein